MEKILLFFIAFLCVNSALAEVDNPKDDVFVEFYSKVKDIVDVENPLNNEMDYIDSNIYDGADQTELKSSDNEREWLKNIIPAMPLYLIVSPEADKHTSEPISLKLDQPTNWYVLILPLVTMFTVVFGTYLSIKTLNTKSKESLLALSESNKNQYNMNKENIEYNRDRARENTISENRQEWINTLRNDVSSILSTMTKYKSSKLLKADQEYEYFSLLWLEFYKIQLLINRLEEKHTNLVQCIKDALKTIHDADIDDLKNKQDDIVRITQIILKNEWVRVKEFS